MAYNGDLEVAVTGLHLAENEAEEQNIEQVLEATIGELNAEDEKIQSARQQSYRYDLSKVDPLVIAEAGTKLKILPRCVQCKQDAQPSTLCVCTSCNGRPYHRGCWQEVPNHQPMEGFPCCDPPVDYNEYVWVQHLLDSKVSKADQIKLHKKDIWAMWFGVPHQQERPLLWVYPTLQYLIDKARIEGSHNTDQYPSLVSFFGDTGGGKSSIIRALIRNTALNDTNPAPVPGNSANRHKSTSGDVHIYADPATINKEVPLFYADCEGFRGAGISAATQVAEGDPESVDSLSTATNKGQTTKAASKHPEAEDHQDTVSYKFDLQWGHCKLPNVVSSATKANKPFVDDKTRQSVVKDLYPRFLYTFSDVVCYITNNFKATESELFNLFEWAAKGHEWTRNQRVRPGLVIVVNKDSPSLGEEDWLDVEYATKTMLSHLELSPAFAELRLKWHHRGVQLNTAEDLIFCYYSSFRIVVIPTLTPGTVHSIAMQYQKLYQEIRDTSERLRARKHKLGVDLTVENFQKYVQDAFSRLAKDLTSWIDFHYMGMKYSPRPQTFTEHVTALLQKVRKHGEVSQSGDNLQEADLVSCLTPFIACTIASAIPKNASEEVQLAKINTFLADCGQALERFRDTSWRCEFRSGGQRCLNYYVGHDKGHQFVQPLPTPDGLRKVSTGSSTSISAASLLVGEFHTSFEPGKIMEEIYTETRRLLTKGDNIEMATTMVAKASGVALVSSNWTCFACLSQCPVYMLPCDGPQHAICEQCAVRFTDKSYHSQSSVVLKRCPLGCYFKKGSEWRSRIKPPSAGVRLLSLDGGGVRGIIELVMLKRLVAAVGFDIPIQELFDLVIGTSTGGIIALGLFKMNWSVDRAISEFEKLSNEAFSQRFWLKIRAFRHPAQLLYSHRFKSEGIELALQKAFKHGRLFEYSEHTSSEKVKVGVVVTQPGTHRPFLLSNYSRNSTGQASDTLIREEDALDELQIWEAARSTSAAPTYFPSFHHKATNREYIDGAWLRNNPVQTLEDERKAIWSQNNSADLILSLGTGLQADVGGKVIGVGRRSRLYQSFVPQTFKGKVAVGVDMVQSTLDCNRQWDEFSAASNNTKSNICHRLNVGLGGRPPHLNDTEKISLMKGRAEEYLKPDSDRVGLRHGYLNPKFSSAHDHVQAIARRLIASIFYFEGYSIDDNGLAVGTLHCRLSSNVADSFLQITRVQPQFRLCYHDPAKGRPTAPLPVTFDVETFSGPVSFKVVAEQLTVQMKLPKWSVWEPISGFSS